MSLFTRLRSLSLVAKIVIVLLLVIAAFAYLALSSSRSLARDVSAYAAAQRALSQATFLPGAANNPSRQALNGALTNVLTGTLSDADRLKASQDGLALLRELEDEIDRVADARVVADVAREQLRHDRLSIEGLPWQGALAQLDDLATQQLDIVADVRGLSYSANYHTSQIFEQVIQDQGALRSEFVTKLNSEIPQVESDFNKRSNLYAQLEAIDNRIDRILSTLPGGEGPR